MPTYEYACRSCGEHLEAVQSFSEPPLTSCPRCGGELRKVFGAVGIVFKGSGFYKTDSRSTPSAASSSKSVETVSPPAGGGDTKADAKPDTKKTEPSPGASTAPAATPAAAAPSAGA